MHSLLWDKVMSATLSVQWFEFVIARQGLGFVSFLH